MLDSLELVPMRAKAASIIIHGDVHATADGYSNHAGRTAKAGGVRLALQLPSPTTHLASTSGTQQQQGDAVWEELVKTQLSQPQQPQQQKQGAQKAVKTAAGPRSSQLQNKVRHNKE